MVVVAAIAVGLVAAVFLLAPRIQENRSYGYFGVFLANLLGNGTILLPVPSAAVIFATGAILSWQLVGLVGGVGAALGETVGYFAGRGGGAIVDYQPSEGRLAQWLARRATVTFFLLSVVPNPINDIACIWAGVQRYSFVRFFLAVWAGKTVKGLVLARAGAQSVTWLARFV